MNFRNKQNPERKKKQSDGELYKHKETEEIGKGDPENRGIEQGKEQRNMKEKRGLRVWGIEISCS